MIWVWAQYIGAGWHSYDQSAPMTRVWTQRIGAGLHSYDQSAAMTRVWAQRIRAGLHLLHPPRGASLNAATPQLKP